jgi:hypothetical protein
MAPTAMVATMRRLITLVTIACCASCTPGLVPQQQTSPSLGKISNRAAVIPADIGLPQIVSPTPVPRNTATPAPAESKAAWDLTMLTHGGCCPGAFWSADSREVRFLARPEPAQPASIYGVPRNGGPAKLVCREPAYFSPGDVYTVTASGEDVVIERAADGKRWKITTGGRRINFSHSMGSVAWTESSDAYTNLNLIQRTIWITDLGSGQSSRIITVVGGGLIGWTEGDAAVLVSGGLVTGGPRGVWRVAVTGGEPELLFEADEVQGALISPDGAWLAFFVAFGSDPERNGLWVMSTQGGSVNRLSLFGSYRWRDEGRLLIIPLVVDPRGDGLWQYKADEDSVSLLFHPGEVPFEVANNDWSVSPDGEYIAFRSNIDLSIWTLGLPPE